MTAVPAKVAVIGSNSFSGSSFIAHCLARGAEVIGVSRSPEPHASFLPYRWSNSGAGYRFFRFDLNRDLAGIMALIDAERPAYVVNFAAQSMVGESWKSPEHWFQTNVVSTIKLHDQLRCRDFLQRYVHVTTPEVYGSVTGTIREDAPFNPSTPYAVSRAAADMSLRTFFETYDFPVVFTRAANVYGPGQQFYRIVPRTILSIRQHRKLGLQGGGRSLRSFIHIDDVCAATWSLMSAGVPGETYHISTDEFVTVRQLVERICGLARRVLRRVASRSRRTVSARMRQYALDSTKLRRDLGWREHVTLDQGLRDCVAWVDRHLPELLAQPFDYLHKP